MSNYKYKCMENPWIRRPAMILFTLPLGIFVLGQMFYEEFPGFVREWLATWRGEV